MVEMIQKEEVLKNMSKKKRTKKGVNKVQKDYEYLMKYSNDRSKKSLNDDFRKALKDIEKMQLTMYEVDKKYNSKNRRKINKEEEEFYTSIESIKHRRKLAKRWEKQGFLDNMVELLKQVSPLIQMLAKALATLIVTFLSIDGIKRVISPNTLEKITHVFDIAMAI